MAASVKLPTVGKPTSATQARNNGPLRSGNTSMDQSTPLPNLLNRSRNDGPDASRSKSQKQEPSRDLGSYDSHAAMSKSKEPKKVVTRDILSMLPEPSPSQDDDHSRDPGSLLNKIANSLVKEVAANTKLKDPSEPKMSSVELDEKLGLWNSIVEQRKKLYNQTVKDINNGLAAGYLEDDGDDGFNSKKKRDMRKEAEAIKKRKDQGYGLDIRIQVDLVGDKDRIQTLDISHHPTPDDFLDVQIEDIFAGKLKKAEVIDYRMLGVFVKEAEKKNDMKPGVTIGNKPNYVSILKTKQ